VINVEIKNNLKAILKERGFTPYKLAKKLNKPANHFYVLVKRETIPEGTALRTMIDIAQALDVPVDSLFTVEDSPPNFSRTLFLSPPITEY